MYFKHTYIVIIITMMTIKAQGQRVLDTLYANERQIVSLFFPDPIEKAVTGYEGFVFTYNRENGSCSGLLQATPGQDSNLLVITTDKSVYSYYLKYAKKVPRYTYFVRSEERVGYANPMYEAKNQSHQERDSLIEERESFEGVSKMLLTKTPGHLAVRRKSGMLFRLEHMVYQDKVVYLVFQIGNRSGIDFEMGALDLNIITGSRKKRAAYQETPLKVRYAYRYPKIVEAGTTKRFVYVVPKFVLAEKERLQAGVYELHGHRLLTLTRP